MQGKSPGVDEDIIQGKSSGVDEDTPEFLYPESAPVQDPYSSDEGNMSPAKKLKRNCGPTELNDTTNTMNIRESADVPRLKLSKNMDATSISGEQLHYYYSIQYNPIEEDIYLDDKTLEECLCELFKFTFSDHFQEESCTWDGQTMAEISEPYRRNVSCYSWLFEHDNINWKESTSKEKLEKEKYFFELQCTVDNFEIRSLLNISLKAYELYQEKSSQPVIKQTSELSGRYRVLTSLIEAIANVISSYNFIRSGLCSENLSLYVPHDVITDDSPLIKDRRSITVTTRPDGVFTSLEHVERGDSWNLTWAIPIQLYAEYGPSEKLVNQKLPDDGMITKPPKVAISPVMKPEVSCNKQTKSSPTQKETKDKSAAMLKPTISKPTESKPTIFKDKLRDPVYFADVQKYIAMSLPEQCRKSDCGDKMAGQNVVQLLCAARTATCSHVGKNGGILNVVGLFMVNEYVYFSRLDIERDLLFYLQGFPYAYVKQDLFLINNITKRYRSYADPTVSYSNWRLDLTIASHRLALLIFLQVYGSYHNRQK